MTVNRRTTFAADLGATAFPDGLRDYQTRAVQRVEGVMSSGRSRCWLVLPPGAGKTLTALEAARRLGNRVVVFVPNTAIQGQWMRTWQRFVPQNLSVGTDRDLRDPITVLTYQSLAVFDGEADASSAAEGSLLDLLHGNGRALVAALREAGPLTIVLDECHHLLEVWGRLVAELLDGLDAARVIGLTATPPDALTTGQAELVRRLFGEPLYGASLPAVIKSGYLAPFAELAYLVEPTFVEAGYIHGEAGRFAEFRNDLMDPEFATTGFLAWCDGRFVERTTDLDGQALPWVMLERQDPKLADAALRLHHAGLLALPPGARVREQHRQSPTAEDWVALLDTYVDECLRRSADERDASAVEAIRKALPAIGYRLTSKGIRAAQSPVDRVLARSDAKTDAAVEIVAAEGAQLGAQLRALVLCDFEQAAASSSARLAGVLDAQAGAALLTLRRLTEDDRTADLSPMLVTGRTVAAGHEDARAFVHWVKSQHPDRDLDLDVEPHEGVARVRGNGNWTSRTWVALVTSYFESGGCRVLVGTRALLGEGWDARGVNAVIDLTGATTVGSIVQMRGRGLRLDPQWAEKVTNNWTVVCVTGEHPKGAADWNRFVRKHEGYLAVTATGDVMSGIGHVDPTFSPYAPPESALLGAVNATMLTRAERRDVTRDQWAIGAAFTDQLTHTIRIRAARTATQGTELSRLAEPGRHARPRPLPGATGILIGKYRRWSLWLAPHRAATLLAGVAGGPPIAELAYVVADALHAAGQSGSGAESVDAVGEPDGTYRIELGGVDRATSRMFTEALDELVGPIADPRWFIPRFHLAALPADRRERRAVVRAWLAGRAPHNAVLYHAVPTVFARSAKRLSAFTTCWNDRISPGAPVASASPEGEGVLVTHRGESPLEVTTALRIAWH